MASRGYHRPRMPSRTDGSRDEVEAAVLDALIAGPESGMTIFELRSHVDYDIEALEPALANLREDGKITVEYGEDRSVILPAENVRHQREGRDDSTGWIDRVRRRLFGP